MRVADGKTVQEKLAAIRKRFVDEWPASLQGLRDAAQPKGEVGVDYVRLERLAHALVGAAGSVGCGALCPPLRAIEHAAASISKGEASTDSTGIIARALEQLDQSSPT